MIDRKLVDRFICREMRIGYHYAEMAGWRPVDKERSRCFDENTGRYIIIMTAFQAVNYQRLAGISRESTIYVHECVFPGLYDTGNPEDYRLGREIGRMVSFWEDQGVEVRYVDLNDFYNL